MNNFKNMKYSYGLYSNERDSVNELYDFLNNKYRDLDEDEKGNLLYEITAGKIGGMDALFKSVKYDFKTDDLIEILNKKIFEYSEDSFSLNGNFFTYEDIRGAGGYTRLTTIPEPESIDDAFNYCNLSQHLFERIFLTLRTFIIGANEGWKKKCKTINKYYEEFKSL